MIQFDDSFTDSRLEKLKLRGIEREVEASASTLGFKYVNLVDHYVNPEALRTIAEKKSKSASIVAFEINRNDLSVATKNPNSPATQEVIQDLINKKYNLSIHVCSDMSLDYVWKKYADISETVATKKGTFQIEGNLVVKLIERIKSASDIPSILKEIDRESNTQKISELIALVFAGALALKASDIHIEPEDNVTRLRYRLDGILHDVLDFDKNLSKRMSARLKLLSGMRLNVRVEAQDGRFTFNTGEREVEVRSSIIPGAYGESFVLRILDTTVAGFSMDKINLNPYIEKALKIQLKKPNGLIITTGPTGSGKTTALYAFLREIHTPETKIITIENPVEYRIEGIVHTQVEDDYTFATGLRAVLRQDPDVIMVGEIRDKEVAETAIHAAQTGHLVFSTLHTNSAVGGFTRLVDLGIDREALGGSLNVIIGQRLVRLLCEHCKASYIASLEEQLIIKKVTTEHPFLETQPSNTTLYKSVGCEKCGNTGYKGRAGIFEGIIMDDAVEEVVLKDPREAAILEAAKPQKIPTMLQDGMEKVLQGVTSMTELERVIEFPHIKSETEKETKTPPPVISDDDFLSHVV